MDEVIFKKRCSGHCCRDLMLQGGKERLDRLYESAMSSGTLDEIDRDAILLKHLLVHKETNYLDSNGNKSNIPVDHFTCSAFDGTNCTIYPYIPAMCREHPFYGNSFRKCDFKDCTLTYDFSPELLEKAKRTRKLFNIRSILTKEHYETFSDDFLEFLEEELSY